MEYGVLLVPSVRDRPRLGREVDSAVARHPRGAWSRASKGAAGVGRRAIELTEIDRHANAGLGPPRDHEPAPRQKQVRASAAATRLQRTKPDQHRCRRSPICRAQELPLGPASSIEASIGTQAPISDRLARIARIVLARCWQ